MRGPVFFRITPDETVGAFAVHRGSLTKRLDARYHSPKYSSVASRLQVAYGDRLVPLGKISSVVCGPFGSAIKSDDYCESGIPLIRISNITKTGRLDYSDLTYISKSLGNHLAGTQVRAGDIVISQRGSLGQCAVVDNTYEKLNISANIIAIKDIRSVSAEFLRYYLGSNIAQELLARCFSGQVQQKITTSDIAGMLVPLPSPTEQEELAAYLDTAFERRAEKLREADHIILTAKNEMLRALGITFPNFSPSLFGYSRYKMLREVGIYCNAHTNYLNHVFELLRANPYCAGELSDYAEVNPFTDRGAEKDEAEVAFVPMSAVTEKTNVVTYTKRLYADVKTGYTIFQRGDLLWAKITPCMQNGKSFLSDEMPTQVGCGSTEFHVLRRKSPLLYMPYLWVLLTEEHILEAAQGMFGGSAGQQRVSENFLKSLPIVLPNLNMQKSLADSVFSALTEATHLKQQAEREWEAAKVQFEKSLLGE